MAVTLTVELAGPSGKVQSKLLAAAVSVRCRWRRRSRRR